MTLMTIHIFQQIKGMALLKVPNLDHSTPWSLSKGHNQKSTLLHLNTLRNVALLTHKEELTLKTRMNNFLRGFLVKSRGFNEHNKAANEYFQMFVMINAHNSYSHKNRSLLYWAFIDNQWRLHSCQYQRDKTKVRKFNHIRVSDNH